nr:phage antirepressor KilAC domain-containing protein [Bacillus sp. ISL-37]
MGELIVKQVEKLFKYNENLIRTNVVGDDIYFIAKDVCDVLGIADTSKAVGRLDDDEKGTNTIPTPGGFQTLLTINESGLYSLILTSRKPEARQFKRWVTHEVLPTIRKRGAYMTEDVLQNAISNPDFMIGLLEKLKEDTEKIKQLEQRVETDQPKVTYYDSILSSIDAVNIGQIAEDYGLSARRLNQILKEERVQRRIGGQWILYQEYKNMGLTKSKTFSIGENGSRIHTQWTQKGRLFIHDLLDKRGVSPVSDIL